MVASRDGRWVFASDYYAQAGIAVIDVSTNAIVERITGLGELFGIKLLPDGSRLFADGGWQNSIYVIDAITHSILTNIGTGGISMEMDLTCDGSELYVLNNTNSIPVINTQTYNIDYQIQLPGSASSGIAICPQYVAKGVFFNPPEQNKFGKAGSSLTYSTQLHNFTGASDRFDLTVLPGNAWPTTLSINNTGVILDGGSITFTVQVEIPASASPGDKDSVSIQAASVASPDVYNATAKISTLVSGGKIAYVTFEGNNQMALVDTVVHTVIGTVDLETYGCINPSAVKLTPDGSKLYILCPGSSTMLVFDTATNSFVTKIDHPAWGNDVAFTQDGRYALVTERDQLQIDVLDTSINTIVKSIATPKTPTGIAVHPFLPIAYVGGYECCYSGNVMVIDTTNFTLITSINDNFSYNFINDVAVSPDGRWVYAGRYNGSDWGMPGMAVIDTNTNSEVTDIWVGGSWMPQITPDGSRLFAAGGWSNSVYVIDTTTNSYLTSVGVGGRTFDNELSCDGSELYVADHTDTVPVIDTQTYNIAYHIQMPTGETNQIAICPQYVSKGNGVYLIPGAQTTKGGPGQVVTNQETLVNLSDSTDSFQLTLGNHAWKTTLSTVTLGPIEDGKSATFTVSVTVPQDAPGNATDKVTVTATSVNNPGAYSATAELTTQALPLPVADFSYSPSDPNAYDTVYFWSNSYDPGGSWIQSFAWDFGDGTTSTDGSPTHRFAADGDYNVKLSATTADGRTGSITKTVSVRTHDVVITKFTVPQSAKAGQTRSITVDINN